MHVLLNVYATIALQEVIALLRAGDVHRATHKLATVTTYVKGFAPARAHAATLPSDFYIVVVPLDDGPDGRRGPPQRLDARRVPVLPQERSTSRSRC